MHDLFTVLPGSLLSRMVRCNEPGCRFCEKGGRRRDDCFFSLDLTLTGTQILETFSQRWPLEVCFRGVKRFFGSRIRNRVAEATARTAALIYFICDLVLLCHAQCGYRLAQSPHSITCGIHKKSRFPVRTFSGRSTSRYLAGKDIQRPRSGSPHPKTSTLCGMAQNAGLMCKTLHLARSSTSNRRAQSRGFA